VTDVKTRQSELGRTRVRRCPYCVDDGEFKVMSANDYGDWLICARCGHLVVVEDPEFECTCAKCAELTR